MKKDIKNFTYKDFIEMWKSSLEDEDKFDESRDKLAAGYGFDDTDEFLEAMHEHCKPHIEQIMDVFSRIYEMHGVIEIDPDENENGEGLLDTVEPPEFSITEAIEFLRKCSDIANAERVMACDVLNACKVIGYDIGGRLGLKEIPPIYAVHKDGKTLGSFGSEYYDKKVIKLNIFENFEAKVLQLIEESNYGIPSKSLVEELAKSFKFNHVLGIFGDNGQELLDVLAHELKHAQIDAGISGDLRFIPEGEWGQGLSENGKKAIMKEKKAKEILNEKYNTENKSTIKGIKDRIYKYSYEEYLCNHFAYVAMEEYFLDEMGHMKFAKEREVSRFREKMEIYKELVERVLELEKSGEVDVGIER